MRVFVYGTLRDGEGNHRLLENSEFLRDEVLIGFDMFNVGGFPAVIEGDGYVVGEVYEVDEQTLKSLHRLEGYMEDNPDNSMYIPKDVDTDVDSIMIYLWNYKTEGLPPIKSGDWKDRFEVVA